MHEELPDSIVLLQGGHVRTRSAAALAILRGLGRLWPLLSIFLVVPRPLRDWVYDWVYNALCGRFRFKATNCFFKTLLAVLLL